MQQQQQRQQAQQLQNIIGEDISALSPEQQQLVLSAALQGQKGPSAQEAKAQDRSRAIDQGLSQVQQLENLIDQGNIGVISSRIPFPSTLEDVGQYEALSASLIPMLASGISIRNQKEFEKYAKILSDPYQSSYKLKGALRGLRKLLNTERNLLGPSGPGARIPEEVEVTEEVTERPPLSSFYR